VSENVHAHSGPGWSTAVRRLHEANGLPLSPYPTPDELALWSAEHDAADAYAEQFWAERRSQSNAA